MFARKLSLTLCPNSTEMSDLLPFEMAAYCVAKKWLLMRGFLDGCLLINTTVTRCYVRHGNVWQEPIPWDMHFQNFQHMLSKLI